MVMDFLFLLKDSSYNLHKKVILKQTRKWSLKSVFNRHKNTPQYLKSLFMLASTTAKQEHYLQNKITGFEDLTFILSAFQLSSAVDCI